MSHDDAPDHVRTEHYVRALRGDYPDSLLARLIQDHLVRECPHCRAAWEQLGDDRFTVLGLLQNLNRADPSPSPTAPPARPAPTALAAHIRELEGEVDRLRAARVDARAEYRELRDLPHERRVDKIQRAYRRYRSRALAELLIEESRKRITTDPADAASLAACIAHVLHRTPGPGDQAWIHQLRARGAAHEANALRVAGDLPAADRRFATLRRNAAEATLGDESTLAEIASLEASLRIEQRRFAEAEDLLDRGALLFHLADDQVGQAKVLIQKANMLLKSDRVEQALSPLQAALQVLDPEDSLYLYFCAVNARVLALTELERYSDAEALLDQHLDVYEATDEVYAGALLRHLKGRIALGLEQYNHARNHLESSRDAYLSFGRYYDATVVSLDLAHLLFITGRHHELKHLASHLVAIFEDQQVPRETLAALTLLTRAAAAEQVSLDLLDRLRAQIERSSHIT